MKMKRRKRSSPSSLPAAVTNAGDTQIHKNPSELRVTIGNFKERKLNILFALIYGLHLNFRALTKCVNSCKLMATCVLVQFLTFNCIKKYKPKSVLRDFSTDITILTPKKGDLSYRTPDHTVSQLPEKQPQTGVALVHARGSSANHVAAIPRTFGRSPSSNTSVTTGRKTALG